MSEKKINPSVWYEVMKYIREVPGTVYEDQIRDLLLKLDNSIQVSKKIDEFLNQNIPDISEFVNTKKFLKKDNLTGEIYTIPSQRKFLDSVLSKECALKYNPFLYETEYHDTYGSRTMYDLKQPQVIKDNVGDDKIFRNENGILNIKLDEGCIIENFNISFVIKNLDSSVKSIGYIVAEGVIFKGKTSFSFDDNQYPSLLGGMFFDRAVFEDDFEMRNFTFDFNHSAEGIPSGRTNKVDFRNTRFFKNVSFKNVWFEGDTSNVELSFEDSRIQYNAKFITVAFGHTKLNFFQTIFGEFIDFVEGQPEEHKIQNEILLVNSSFSEDSEINFSDAEIHNGKITLKNISNMPTTKLCFSPIIYTDSRKDDCPDCILEIENCENTHTLYIGNVSELSLKNTRNYGKIVSADNWGNFDKPKTKGLFGTRIGGTRISNNLLIAVYNYGTSEDKEKSFYLKRDKVNDFMILKENFASLGAYDDEDDAFILYMEFKPFSISKKGKKSIIHLLLYRVLYDTGKYGISPGRVIFALLSLVMSFTVIYLIYAIIYGTGAFSIGHTYNNQFNYADFNTSVGFTCTKLLASFLYSLEGVFPYVSQFEPIHVGVCIFTAIENAIGSFLVGYFSVAVVRKTLR